MQEFSRYHRQRAASLLAALSLILTATTVNSSLEREKILPEREDTQLASCAGCKGLHKVDRFHVVFGTGKSEKKARKKMEESARSFCQNSFCKDFSDCESPKFCQAAKKQKKIEKIGGEELCKEELPGHYQCKGRLTDCKCNCKNLKRGAAPPRRTIHRKTDDGGASRLEASTNPPR